MKKMPEKRDEKYRAVINEAKLDTLGEDRRRFFSADVRETD